MRHPKITFTTLGLLRCGGIVFSCSLIKVFDFSGNLINTFETGGRIKDLSYNPTGKSILFTFDDEMQFGQIPLMSIIN